MISEITARNFKGLEFVQPVSKKTLFLGKIGVGKSARAQALTLALLGYIPGSGKTNDEILSSYGSAEVLVVGFTLDGTKFERAWGRTTRGSVQEAFKVDGTKISKETFITTLGAKGNPKIFDLSLFLDFSDQKKINYIMSLYPCGEDLSGIETMIETQKKNINTLEDKARTTEKAGAVLTANRAAMQLPAGSLAETIAEIEKTEKEIDTAQTDLNEAKLQKATTVAKEEGKKEGVQEGIKIGVDKKVSTEAHITDHAVRQPITVDESAPISEKVFNSVHPVIEPTSDLYAKWDKQEVLSGILTAMDAAGCEVCAARMIIKKELKNAGQ